MKKNREYILRRAFDVFMEKGYDSTSISVLHKELNISRGAMYRYFENKDELFRSVIDEYVLKLLNRILNQKPEGLTLHELIEYVYRRQKLYVAIFNRVGVSHSVFLNYTALLIQAAKHYPNFVSLLNEIHRKFHTISKAAIRRSKALNEIRQDTNIEVVSKLYNNIWLQESSDEYPSSSIDNEGFIIKMRKDIENRKYMLDYLYSLIKI